MEFIAVYDKDAKDYSGKYRLGFLQNAKDVCILQEINGTYNIKLTLPQGDPKWGLVKEERKIGYANRIFRIKRIEGTEIIGNTLLQDTCRTHVQYIGDMIGMPANLIFEAIFKNSPYVRVLTETELAALGLEAVTDEIDFFEMSKKTPIGCMNVLMETLKKYRVHSEIYIDNEKIGLVRQLGKDKEYVVDPRYNACEITPTIDTYNLVTKLYPYGKDDLPLDQSYRMLADGSVEPLGNTTDGVGYILSPNYDILGEYEAYSNFDEIEEQDDLLSAGLLQFDSNNIERIDIPKLSYNLKTIDIKGEVKLGDTITVNDIDNGVKPRQRVISVTEYPFEPHKNSITVGVTPITNQETFTGMFDASQYLRLYRNEKKEFKTCTLEFMKKNADVTVENDGEFQKIAQYETGALFVSPNGQYAVAIIDGKIKIGVADSSKADGWNWIGVFGHGEGDAATQTYLYTNLITIMSESGELKIENNLIQMFDDAGTLRFNAGYSESLGKYVFELYNANGKQTAYIDDDGNLTICGIFKTGEDGEARTVIDGNGIQSYDEQGRKSGLWCNDYANLAELTLYYNGNEFFRVYNSIDGSSLYANGHAVLQMSSSGAKGVGSWTFENGASGSFATADGKTVTVKGGLITAIT